MQFGAGDGHPGTRRTLPRGHRDGDLVASLIPGARLELLQGAGHLFLWEQPQRSADLVRRFALDARVLSSP